MSKAKWQNIAGSKKIFTLSYIKMRLYCMGVVPGGAGGAMADQLTLSQPGGTDYGHLITTGTPGFSELPTALYRPIQPLFCQAVVRQSRFLAI